MRTLAAKINDDSRNRYASDESHSLDPTKLSDAHKMLSTPGGEQAAKNAIRELWEQANKAGEGYLPTARLSAPLRVLQALVTIGVLEQANDNEERQTVAYRFRLSVLGLNKALGG